MIAARAIEPPEQNPATAKTQGAGRLSLSAKLDLCRALAALIVVAGHVRDLFFVDYSELRSPNIAVTSLYAVTGLGHQAVMVFFVLSGFLVGGSALRAIKDGRWSWREYSRRRLTRLYVVLLPALLLTALWDRSGLRRFGVAVYGGLPSDLHILPRRVAELSGWHTMLGNALFLQDIYVPSFGSNGPLWSLSYEFWYYLLFPFCILALTRRVAGSRRVLYALGAFALGIALGGKVVAYFLVWMLGVALAVILGRTRARRFPRTYLWGTATVFGLSLLLVRLRLATWEFAADLLIGLSFAALLFFLASASRGRGEEEKSQTHRAGIIGGFAGFSYTLYLCHAPPLVYLHVLSFSRARQLWYPDLLHCTIGLALLLCVLTYAWVISLGTEARTDAIRKWLSPSTAPLQEKGYSSFPLSGEMS